MFDRLPTGIKKTDSGREHTYDWSTQGHVISWYFIVHNPSDVFRGPSIVKGGQVKSTNNTCLSHETAYTTEYRESRVTASCAASGVCREVERGGSSTLSNRTKWWCPPARPGPPWWRDDDGIIPASSLIERRPAPRASARHKYSCTNSIEPRTHSR